MRLSQEQEAEVRQHIARYEARRDQLLAEANAAQGAALALKTLLDESENADDASRRPE